MFHRYFSGVVRVMPRVILTALVLLCIHPTEPLAREKTGYTLGVFPYLPPRELEKIYAPIAEDFSRLLGKPVAFESRDSYDKFTEAMMEGKFDIVFTQPFDFVLAADERGFQPLATRESLLAAIIVTLPDSETNSISDLKGKTVASTDQSAAVSFLMKDELIKQGFDLEKSIDISYHRSHFSCMQQVLIRRAEACITARPALRFFEHKMQRKLKIISESQAIPSSLFAASADISPEEADKLRDRIVNWHTHHEGKALLATGKMKSFRRITSADYDVVREIKRRIKN